MRLPALLPIELTSYGEANTEEELFSMLVKNPLQLLQFFESASDDETWSEEFANFTREALKWLTVHFYYDKLSMEFAKRAASAIQKHIKILRPFLISNIAIKLKDKEITVNNLLLGSSSDFFRNLLLRECRDKRRNILPLEDISYEIFSQVEEFIYTGTVENLWKKGQSELMAILKQVSLWEIDELAGMCEKIMSRYINRANALDTLIRAHESRMPILKSACIEFLNNLRLGMHFEHGPIQYLTFEFFEFQSRTLEIFDKVCAYITHLICGGSLIQEPAFSEVVKRCPQLISLDISRSINYSDRLLDIPESLRELDISQCAWLSDAYLRKMIQICPRLERLNLSSNVQLTFAAWADLQKLKGLKALDLSRCHQIADRDFKIILTACHDLTILKLEECSKLTDEAFFALARSLPKLIELNVARCRLSDSMLIEIASRCHNLAGLDLTRCAHISDKGIVEAVKLCPSLRILDIEQCPVSEAIVAKVRALNPALKLIT